MKSLGAGLLLLLLASGGCSGDLSLAPSPQPSPLAGSHNTPACQIFDQTAVQAATGVPMGVGTQVPGPGEADVCQFFATDGTASFAIFIYRGSNPDAAERSYQALTNPHWDPVPGLGDEAKANSSPGSGDIAVRQGSFVVDIQISSSKLTPTLQNLETMAVEAIGRA